MILIKNTIVIFFILQIALITAQSSSKCKKLIDDYLLVMESKLETKGDNIYHLKYSVYTEFSKEINTPSSKTTTEIFSGKDKLIMEDGKMNVYADSKNVFVVVPLHKKIYWSTSSESDMFKDSDTYKRFLEIQKVLLSEAKEISCSNVKDEIVKIKVIPSNTFRSKTRLISQQITFSNKLKRIVNVTTNYTNYNKIKKQEVKYFTIDYKSSKVINSALSYIFDNKKLKSKYRGFQIIDNR